MKVEKVARRLPFYYGWIVVGVAFVTMAICVNAGVPRPARCA
jgi:hypothetical protein